MCGCLSLDHVEHSLMKPRITELALPVKNDVEEYTSQHVASYIPLAVYIYICMSHV